MVVIIIAVVNVVTFLDLMVAKLILTPYCICVTCEGVVALEQ